MRQGLGASTRRAVAGGLSARPSLPPPAPLKGWDSGPRERFACTCPCSITFRLPVGS